MGINKDKTAEVRVLLDRAVKEQLVAISKEQGVSLSALLAQAAIEKYISLEAVRQPVEELGNLVRQPQLGNLVRQLEADQASLKDQLEQFVAAQEKLRSNLEQRLATVEAQIEVRQPDEEVRQPEADPGSLSHLDLAQHQDMEHQEQLGSLVRHQLGNQQTMSLDDLALRCGNKDPKTSKGTLTTLGGSWAKVQKDQGRKLAQQMSDRDPDNLCWLPLDQTRSIWVQAGSYEEAAEKGLLPN